MTYEAEEAPERASMASCGAKVRPKRPSRRDPAILAYLDEFSVFSFGLLSLQACSSRSLITEEGRLRFFRSILILLGTLLWRRDLRLGLGLLGRGR